MLSRDMGVAGAERKAGRKKLPGPAKRQTVALHFPESASIKQGINPLHA
jgi:hypothetical protein